MLSGTYAGSFITNFEAGNRTFAIAATGGVPTSYNPFFANMPHPFTRFPYGFNVESDRL